MNRKKFIRNALLGSASLATVSNVGAAIKNVKQKTSDYDVVMKQVGFNHLPDNKTDKVMKTVYHPSKSRGHANHGWLESNHSFSFAGYYNPEKTNFGALRVLNDDKVAGGKGFGKHSHDNMEIISIPLSGALEHEDNMGNKTIIKAGDIQVMSAGTGIRHSEYNHSTSDEVRFLQIWLFPNQKGVTPRYDQISIRDVQKKNELYQVLSPNTDDDGVWIHQNAWFHMGDFDTDQQISYQLKGANNGVYLFVIEGETVVENQSLGLRDAFGIWNTSSIEISIKSGTQLLLMEVPMGI